MIVSNLQNSQRIEGLHPLFKSLFDYVKTHDLLHADLGRIEVDGDHLFINNVNPECVTSDQQVLELHHDYIDVHILLEGEEMIGWKALEDLQNETKAYSKEEDRRHDVRPARHFAGRLREDRRHVRTRAPGHAPRGPRR